MEEKWQRMVARWLATPEGAQFSQMKATGAAESFARWVWPEKTKNEDRRRLGIGQTKWRMSWFLAGVRYLETHRETPITRRAILAAIRESPSGRLLPVATFDRMWGRARSRFMLAREYRESLGDVMTGTVWRVRPEWLDEAGKVKVDEVERADRELRMERRGMSEERIAHALEAGDAIKPGRMPKFSVAHIVALVDGVALGANEWMRAAIQAHEMSAQTFWKLQKQARDAGLVRRTEDGRWEAISQTPKAVEIDL